MSLLVLIPFGAAALALAAILGHAHGRHVEKKLWIERTKNQPIKEF